MPERGGELITIRIGGADSWGASPKLGITVDCGEDRSVDLALAEVYGKRTLVETVA